MTFQHRWLHQDQFLGHRRQRKNSEHFLAEGIASWAPHCTMWSMAFLSCSEMNCPVQSPITQSSYISGSSLNDFG